MLIRSSSTSVVHTIFSDSPTRDHFDTNNNKSRHPHVHDHFTSKISFIHGVHHLSSPPPAYITKFSRKNCLQCKFIRRVQSDSNLKGLVSTSFDLEEVYKLKAQDRARDKDRDRMLYSEPSFAIYNTDEGLGEEEYQNQDSDMERLMKISDGELDSSVSIGDRIKGVGSDEFSFGRRNTTGLIEEDGHEEDEDVDVKEEVLNGLMKDLGIKEKGKRDGPPMYFVGGVGPDGNGFGGDAANFALTSFDDNGDVSEYYKKMLGEEPSNPLLLRNYAQFLQAQGNLSGAEEYYFRATLADPKDGEILMQYAKFVWELHHDGDKASSYFERAVSAASEDSHVHAAYASFLWEIEESEEENSSQDLNIQIEENPNLADYQNPVNFEEVERPVSPPLHLAAGLGIDTAAFGGGLCDLDYAAIYSADSGNIEEYYKRMVKENPCNALFLRNYAEFLCQSKGDFEGAEEYYSRAILADPVDGEIISQYAKLVWRLYQDKDKALSYFRRAVQATPENSNVLAAYARFLWEAEEDEGDDIIQENHDQVSTLKGATPMASA